MAPRSLDRVLGTETAPLYMVGTNETTREHLEVHLKRAGLSNPVRAGGVDDLARRAESGDIAGVAYLLPAQAGVTASEADRGEGGASHADWEEVLENLVDAVPGCPVVVVGAAVDAARAYRAGATEVIPLAVEDHPETVADQVAAIVERHRGEEFASDLVDETSDGIVVHDPETGEILACNERFYRMLGYDPETAEIGLDDITGHDEEFTRERAVNLIRQAADGSPTTFEWKDPTNDGTDIWVEVKLDAATLDGDRYVVSSVRNIDARKEREQKLRESEEALQRLHDITADPERDFESQVQGLLEFGADQLGMDIAFLSRIDEEEGRFEILEAQGDHPLIQAGNETALRETYCRRAIDDETDGPLAFQNAPAEGMADDPAYEKFGLGCYLGAEITVDGSLYGTLCFADEEPRYSAFTGTERALIDHMAQWLQQELERTEREQELYVRERAMEEASFPLTLADPERADNPLVYVNEAFEEQTGYEEAEAVGRNCRFLQGPETDPETVAAIREAVDAEETISTEIRNYRADGTTFWNRLEITPIYDEDGTLLRYLGSQYDVTEEVRSREVYSQLLSTTRDLMNAASRETVADIVSAAAADILDHDLNAVYLRSESGSPDAAACSDRGEGLFDSPPTTAADGPARRALEQGEPTVVPNIGEREDLSDERYGPVESLLALPLGDAGVLVVGGTESDAFGESEIERGRLLTVNAASALARMDRREDLQRYETLFETVQDKLYVMDSDGYIEMVSEPLADAVGYDREQLEGRHVSEFVTGETAADGEALILDMLVTPDSVSNRYEGALVSRDGTETPVEIELSLLPYDDEFRGTVGAVRDISERRQREEELRVFQQAITEAGIGLAMYGEDGQFEYVNDHYAQTLGRTREEVTSATVWETFEDVSQATFDAYWDSFAAGETRTTETEHRRGDRSTVPVETVTTAVEIDGERHNLVTVQEITGRRERRQQSEVLHRVIRHNLRNDLSVILGHADTLATRLDDEDAAAVRTIRDTADSLQDLTEAAKDAQDIINDDTVRKPVDVVAMLRQELATLQRDFEVTVRTDLPESQSVLADTSLSLALRHLLTNAVEHNDAADPYLGVCIAEATDRSGWVAIEIVDDGPGIPAHEIDVLTAGEETSLQHGSGIGLWVVQWVVTRYGGELEFEESEEGGSVVRIMLPAAETESGSADGGEGD